MALNLRSKENLNFKYSLRNSLEIDTHNVNVIKFSLNDLKPQPLVSPVESEPSFKLKN